VADDHEAGLSLNNLFLPEFRADPYRFYHRLRSRDPVRWDPQQKLWVLTRYADVAGVLTDARFSSERWARDPVWLPQQERAHLGRAYLALQKELLFSDPPGHARLRARVGRAFAGFLGDGLRAHIQRLAHGLLDAVHPQGGMDAIPEFAYPLPFLVMTDILGIPPEHRAQVRKWSDAHGRLASLRWDWLREGLRGFQQLLEYFRALVIERRARPAGDLISVLAASECPEDGPGGDALLANCALLLTTAHETTTNLIGNALLNLLRHPDQLQRLKEEPDLVPSAVEELLRYDSPKQGTSRFAREDLELAGKRIARGQTVFLLLGAANRDPEQFPEPDQLDLARHDNRHLAFARGIHYCLGAELARLECQVALSAILEHFPGLRLAEVALDWHPNHIIRGLKSLWVIL
jgi:cytochrome P450